MKRTDIKVGDIVQHFKREVLFDKNNQLYLYKILEIAEHTAMFNENEMASNTFENPNRVQMKSVAVTDSKKVVLQPYSVNFIRLKNK